jgi:K+-sensing histidine kinase KdpD
VIIPLRIEGHAIGALTLAPGRPRLSTGDPRDTLSEALALLAGTAADLCQHQLDLEHRVKEVQALYRLSSMLARATNLDRVLEIALESALDVLELDAGSIVLFEQEEGPTMQTEVDLVLRPRATSAANGSPARSRSPRTGSSTGSLSREKS